MDKIKDVLDFIKFMCIFGAVALVAVMSMGSAVNYFFPHMKDMQGNISALHFTFVLGFFWTVVAVTLYIGINVLIKDVHAMYCMIRDCIKTWSE